MTSKKKIRILIAKDPAGNVTAIGVPAPEFAGTIGLHPSTGGTVDIITVAARSKTKTSPLEPTMIEELLESGRLKTQAPTTRSKRR